MDEPEYSILTGVKRQFGTWDYVVFALTLGASGAIGVFYAIKDRNQQNTKEYLLAGRKMHWLPVSMSMVASFMSAITLLGNPAEMYLFNTMFMWLALTQLITMAITAHIFIPIYYNLKITSAYEYLERRFSRGVRCIGSLVFTIWMLLYMSIVLYGPSLALNAVTGISLWGSVLAVGLVCTAYTALGGMKAVLWTDTLQTLIMIAGVMAALIKGCMVVGGLSSAWEIARQNGRIVFDEIDPDPRVRHSVWSVWVGTLSTWLSLWSANQAQVQRVLSCKSLKTAKIAVWMNIPGLWLIMFITCMSGIVMYAFYESYGCDPLTSKLVGAGDQLFPLFVMDILGDFPGLPGLFVAAIFSGSLSTISSGLNSISAVLLEDVVKTFWVPKIAEKPATNMVKILAVLLGLVVIGLAYLASEFGGILQGAYSIAGVLSAPLFGMFFLGMLVPWTNKWGIYSGVLCSLSFTGWICIGAIVSKFPKKLSPLRTDGCTWRTNGTTTFTSATTMAVITSTTSDVINEVSESGLSELYKVSYLWYGVFSFIIIVLVGIIVSFITGATDPKTIDPELICPVFDVICPWLSEKTRKKLYFGVRHDIKKVSVDEDPIVLKGSKYTKDPSHAMVETNYNEGYDDD